MKLFDPKTTNEAINKERPVNPRPPVGGINDDKWFELMPHVYSGGHDRRIWKSRHIDTQTDTYRASDLD